MSSSTFGGTEQCPCIYCGKNAADAIGVEHVVPECLGFQVTLERGVVCDDCNASFSKLDAVLLAHPRIAEAVLLSGSPSKSGKPRTQLLDGRVRVQRRPDGVTSLTMKVLDRSVNAPIHFTKIGESFSIPAMAPPLRGFTAAKFSRALHKSAFNAMALQHGREAALNPAYDQVKRFIRAPHNSREFRVVGVGPNVKKQNGYDVFDYSLEDETRTGRVSVRVLELRIHYSVFAVCLTGDSVEAEKVLKAHVARGSELKVLVDNKDVMSTVRTRSVKPYLTLDRRSERKDFEITISDLEIELQFGPGDAGGPKRGDGDPVA